MPKITRIILILIAVIILVFAGFSIWALTPPEPMTEAYSSLNSDAVVKVSYNDSIIFSPVNSTINTGLIIYPGGRVDYRSYAPLAREISEKGYLCIILKMPFNLAVFGIDNADAVIAAYSNIRYWAIAGHSLGGSMAAEYAVKHPGKIQGLVLWASYPASGTDLSGSGLKVATIHGTNDGLVTAARIDTSMKLLPADTIRVEIQGGNHAQFGWYGKQSGDKEATISREDQQSQVVEATVQLLSTISSR